MTLGQQSSLVFWVTAALYLIGGGWLLVKGKPVRAGILMTLVSLLPIAWQVNFTDSDAKGFGLLLLLMLPPALGVIVCGAGWWIYQVLTRPRRSFE